MEITTNAGEKYSYRADYAIGEPELPMSMDEFKAKTTQPATLSSKSPKFFIWFSTTREKLPIC